MTGPEGNSEFCFPRISLERLSLMTLRGLTSNSKNETFAVGLSLFEQ